MSPYEQHLQAIGNRITINDADREVYTKDFDKIRDYMLGIMCKEDDIFNRIYKGPSLFGSYANNVRINYPNEFDVIFTLSVPFSSRIHIDQDENRPGFVKLDFSDVTVSLKECNGYNGLLDKLTEMVDSKNSYLRRTNLQRWLEELVENALLRNGNRVVGHWGDIYTLEYSKRGLAHTIYARCTKRNISIDFIPAMVFGAAEWMEIRRYQPFTFKCRSWYAIPKPSDVGPKSTSKYAFQICNPKAEKDLLLGRQNLKVVFRLLKALRNKYDMPRLKSYFITTAFLWEVEKKKSRKKKRFWNNPLHIILEHMLDVLHDYFSAGFLPFFWDRKLNLLSILDDDEIKDYADKLRKAYNTLSSYKHQPNLCFGTCATHFEILK